MLFSLYFCIVNLFPSFTCLSCLILFQECFKGNWNAHKEVHKKERINQQLNTRTYNPWPGYMFTGKLRPHPLVRKGHEFIKFSGPREITGSHQDQSLSSGV